MIICWLGCSSDLRELHFLIFIICTVARILLHFREELSCFLRLIDCWLWCRWIFSHRLLKIRWLECIYLEDQNFLFSKCWVKVWQFTIPVWVLFMFFRICQVRDQVELLQRHWQLWLLMFFWQWCYWWQSSFLWFTLHGIKCFFAVKIVVFMLIFRILRLCLWEVCFVLQSWLIFMLCLLVFILGNGISFSILFLMLLLLIIFTLDLWCRISSVGSDLNLSHFLLILTGRFEMMLLEHVLRDLSGRWIRFSCPSLTLSPEQWVFLSACCIIPEVVQLWVQLSSFFLRLSTIR